MAETTNTTTTTTEGATIDAADAASTIATAIDTMKQSASANDSAAEIERLKAAITKANKENAELNRKLRTKQTDEENAAADQQAKWDEVQELVKKQQATIEALTKERETSEAKASFLALPGFDDTLAGEASSALVGGDRKKLFDGLKKAFEAHEKSLKQQAYKNMPGPDGAGGGEKRADVDLGKSFGKARADAMKGSNETLKKYQL